MRRTTLMIGAALLTVAGCTAPMETAQRPDRVGNLPANVASMAAPNQDLSTARLLSEDGCYWYEHNGPVETTLVPLRAVGGNPICTQRAT